MPFRRGDPNQPAQSREAQKASAKVPRSIPSKNTSRESEAGEAKRIVQRNQRDKTS